MGNVIANIVCFLFEESYSSVVSLGLQRWLGTADCRTPPIAFGCFHHISEAFKRSAWPWQVGIRTQAGHGIDSAHAK